MSNSKRCHKRVHWEFHKRPEEVSIIYSWGWLLFECRKLRIFHNQEICPAALNHTDIGGPLEERIAKSAPRFGNLPHEAKINQSSPHITGFGLEIPAFTLDESDRKLG